MVPSNPSNGQPLIFRILDSLGVAHIVACFNHTHDKSEVDGLVASLNGKQNTLTFDSTPTANSTNPVTSGGVKTALNGKANVLHGHESIGCTGSAQDASVSCERATVRITAEDEVVISIEGQDVSLNVDNYDNLVRAIANPDSTPTADSDHLVTSGGVKAALDAKAQKSVGEVWGEEFLQSIDLDRIFQDGREMQTFAILAGQDSLDLDEVFATPSSGLIVYPQGSIPTIHSSHYAAIRVLKTIDPGNSTVYLVILDAIFDYSA